MSGQRKRATGPVDRTADEDRWRALVDRFLTAHPGGRDRLIPLLHALQLEIGHLPFELQEHVAGKLGLSPAEVYGVVSFYDFFSTAARGRCPIRVCLGTACFVRQARRLVDAMRSRLGIELGEVTEDGVFSLEEVRCIGACSHAPAMAVGDAVYPKVEHADLDLLVRRLTGGKRRAGDAAGDGDDG